MTRISITPEDRVFVLTGAGISAESGLPTFRASDGLVGRARDRRRMHAGGVAAESRAGVGVLFGAACAGRQGRAQSGARGAGRIGSAAGRPLLSVHAKCGRPARAGGIVAAGAHARRAGQGALRAGVRPAAGRGPEDLPQPGRGRAAARAAGACGRTLFSSARFRWRWSASSRRSRRPR